MRNQPARTGLGELAVPLVQLDCETVGGLLSDRHIGSAVPGEVPRRDCLRGAITSQLESTGRTLNPPRPSPWSKETDWELLSAIARSSGLPPRRWAAMIEVGAKSVPMKIGVRRSKAPEAIPSITETKSDPSEPSLTTARSSTPSPMKSPAVSAYRKALWDSKRDL